MKIRWIGCKEKFSKIYPFNTSLLNRSNQASKGRSRLFQRQAFNCARIFKDPFFTVVKWNHSNPKKKKREKRNVRISLSVGSHNHPDRWGFLILKRITISEKKEISPKLSSRTSSKFFDSNKSSFREFERDYFNYSQLSLIEISRSLKNRLIQKLIIYSQNTSFFFIHKNWIPSESRHSKFYSTSSVSSTNSTSLPASTEKSFCRARIMPPLLLTQGVISVWWLAARPATKRITCPRS